MKSTPPNDFKEDYIKIIYANLTISAILILIILAFAIFIVYHISKIVRRYYNTVYTKNEKFMQAKLGKNMMGTFDTSYDNEVYIDVDQEQADSQFYEDTTYDSINKEIENMIEIHSEDKDAYSSRLQEYKEKTGHDLPEDKIDSSSLIKDFDNWD